MSMVNSEYTVYIKLGQRNERMIQYYSYSGDEVTIVRRVHPEHLIIIT
jgi:hypothetical protein